MKKIILALILVLVIPSLSWAATSSFPGGDHGLLNRGGSTVWPPNTTIDIYTSETYDYIFREKYGSNYRNQIIFWKFDTSSIPDSAVITSAQIRAYVGTKQNNNYFNLNCEYYTWSTLSTSDYTLTADTTAFQVTVASVNASSTNTFSLSNVSNISKTGNTTFRLSIDQTPSSENTLAFHSGNLYLDVTYTTGYTHEVNGVSNSPEINGVSNATEVNGI